MLLSSNSLGRDSSRVGNVSLAGGGGSLLEGTVKKSSIELRDFRFLNFCSISLLDGTIKKLSIELREFRFLEFRLMHSQNMIAVKRDPKTAEPTVIPAISPGYDDKLWINDSELVAEAEAVEKVPNVVDAVFEDAALVDIEVANDEVSAANGRFDDSLVPAVEIA